MSIKANDVLEVLDQYFSGGDPPLLFQLWTHYFPADTRLSVFRSEADWVIVYEIVCWRPGLGEPTLEVFHSGSRWHSSGPDRFQPVFGFCHSDPASDDDFAYPESPYEFCILWGDRRLKFAPTPEEYAAFRIVIDNNDNVDYYGAYILRYLCEKLNHPFFSSKAELRRMLSLPPQQEAEAPEFQALTLIWQTQEWHHPDMMDGIAGEELPSRLPYFRALARAIETSDVTDLERQDPATFNTDWRIYDTQEREQEAQSRAIQAHQEAQFTMLPLEVQEQILMMGGNVGSFVSSISTVETELTSEDEEAQ